MSKTLVTSTRKDLEQNSNSIKITLNTTGVFIQLDSGGIKNRLNRTNNTNNILEINIYIPGREYSRGL